MQPQAICIYTIDQYLGQDDLIGWIIHLPNDCCCIHVFLPPQLLMLHHTHSHHDQLNWHISVRTYIKSYTILPVVHYHVSLLYLSSLSTFLTWHVDPEWSSLTLPWIWIEWTFNLYSYDILCAYWHLCYYVPQPPPHLVCWPWLENQLGVLLNWTGSPHSTLMEPSAMRLCMNQQWSLVTKRQQKVAAAFTSIWHCPMTSCPTMSE